MIEWGEWGQKSLDLIDTPIDDLARITVLEGSVRSAKTVTTIPVWLNYISTGPQGVLAMTGVSKQTIKRNVLTDLLDTVGRSAYSYNQQTGELQIYRRKMQVIGLKDEGSEKYLRGGTYAGALCDEMTMTPESSFVQLLNRLSIRGSKLIGTTNPDSPYHWLYVNYLTDKEKLESGMVRRIHFMLDDNPNLSSEYRDFISKAYSGLFYRRMILGQWVMAEGAIYDMYDESKHVVALHEIPDAFDDCFVGIDYGAGNPTVFVMVGVTTRRDGSHDFWVLREWYHDPRKSGAKTAAQYKAALVEFVGATKVKAYYPDPSALDFINELRSGSSGGQIMNIRHARNEVLPGINTVATYLSQGRLHFARETVVQTLKEIVSYTWDEKAQKLGEDKPVKSNDHGLDATRYAIHTVYPASTYPRGYATA